jgi:hypothetical protein
MELHNDIRRTAESDADPFVRYSASWAVDDTFLDSSESVRTGKEEESGVDWALQVLASAAAPHAEMLAQTWEETTLSDPAAQLHYCICPTPKRICGNMWGVESKPRLKNKDRQDVNGR